MKVSPLAELFPGASMRPISHVDIDSRRMRADGLFIALPGTKFHGHNFLEDVARQGAVAALVEESYAGPDFGLELVRAKDTLKAFQDAASRRCRSFPWRVIGITGSIGKTTTRQFAIQLLEQQFRVAKLHYGYNNHTGVPLGIFTADGDEDLLVLEMGMNHAGEISRLVEIAPPDIAVLVSLDYVHAGQFKDGHAIARAKGEILSSPRTKLALYNADAPWLGSFFGTYTGKRRSFSVHDATCIENWQLPAPHFALNALCARAIAVECNLRPEFLQNPKLSLPPMRFEQLVKQGIHFVNDAYNAAETSYKAALTSLPAPQHGGKSVAVLGHMLELGEQSARAHKAVLGYAKERVSSIICVGEHFRQLATDSKLPWFADAGSAGLALKEQVKAGDVVLLKGSRSLGLERVLEVF